MVIWIEKLVGVHVVDQLLEHGPLHHLAEDGEDSNRSVVLWLHLTTLSFVEWDNLGYFPFCWESV